MVKHLPLFTHMSAFRMSVLVASASGMRAFADVHSTENVQTVGLTGG